jgi:hypothetical protein
MQVDESIDLTGLSILLAFLDTYITIKLKNKCFLANFCLLILQEEAIIKLINLHMISKSLS